MKRKKLKKFLENTPKKTSVPTRGGLWIRAKGRQAIELLHDLFKLVFSFLKVKMTPDYGVLSCELYNFFTIQIIQQS
jgi:hypothetical protein